MLWLIESARNVLFLSCTTAKSLARRPTLFKELRDNMIKDMIIMKIFGFVYRPFRLQLQKLPILRKKYYILIYLSKSWKNKINKTRKNIFYYKMKFKISISPGSSNVGQIWITSNAPTCRRIWPISSLRHRDSSV